MLDIARTQLRGIVRFWFWLAVIMIIMTSIEYWSSGQFLFSSSTLTLLCIAGCSTFSSWQLDHSWWLPCSLPVYNISYNRLSKVSQSVSRANLHRQIVNHWGTTYNILAFYIYTFILHYILPITIPPVLGSWFKNGGRIKSFQIL